MEFSAEGPKPADAHLSGDDDAENRGVYREGETVPTVQAALESQEDFALLAAEVGKMPEHDKKALSEALDVAERALGLGDRSKINSEIVKAVAAHNTGAVIALAIVGSFIIPISAPVVGVTLLTSTVASSVVSKEMNKRWHTARERVRGLRKVFFPAGSELPPGE